MSTGASEPSLPDPDCRLCRHYYVTWDVRLPHGCRMLGFRSLMLPAHEVRLADDSPCLGFEPAAAVKPVRPRALRRGTLCDRKC